MAKQKKSDKIATKAEVKRLIAQGEELRRLTTLPAMATLTSKGYDKLVAQLEKVDKAIAKITKIVS